MAITRTILILLTALISISAYAEDRLGFQCEARHRVQEKNRLFFNIIIDKSTYSAKHKSIEAIIFQRYEKDKSYAHGLLNAYYKTKSKKNPHFYVRQEGIDLDGDVLDIDIYPLGERMLGFANVTISRNDLVMDGKCYRADHLDGDWPAEEEEDEEA